MTFVYLIGGATLCKIGISHWPKARKRTLDGQHYFNGQPTKLLAYVGIEDRMAANYLEHSLHRHFNARRDASDPVKEERFRPISVAEFLGAVVQVIGLLKAEHQREDPEFAADFVVKRSVVLGEI